MKSPLLILHLEDDPKDAELVQKTLAEEAIIYDVVRVKSHDEFTSALEQGEFDLILADIGLPSFDGKTALEIAKRKCPEVPFIFVSGTIGEETAIETLKNGATDYVLKHRLSRLVLAVRRALREAKERVEHKRAEEQIAEQAALLDVATDAILVRDMENNILFWNKGAERLYGWKAEETTGRKVTNLLLKEALPEFEEAMKVVKDKGKWRGELHQTTKDGRKIIVESRWTLVRNDEGEPKSILDVNTNITEKKRFEAQFLRSQRMESIGILAGGIAHDLNNMLAPVMMAMGILRHKLTDESSKHILDTLEKSVQQGADLVKQVLSFARGLESERTILQVRHLISDISKILQQTFPKSVEVLTEIPRDLSLISADPTQLHQVLMNICVNAHDAMPDGGRLTISAENIFVDESYARTNVDAKVGSYIVITLTDTGAGIPREIIDRIFEPFFTTKEPGKGTGLGLSTSYGIVKNHGGFIHVYSEVDKGTQFKVYLPAIETSKTQKAEERKLKLPTGHGELVLIVDDEASIREIARVTLETHDYRVITASDGVEAIALYAQNKEEIKAVITDMMMPILDGSTTIRALRRIEPEVKVIALSGLKENSEVSKILNINIQAFLPKPFTAEVLLQTLHKVLNLNPN
ncbi:MAG TPA: response regulator [Thermodesulfobacteriota bacterium]|nr:response regulator [Thermodesulfobacteriota bacterium]